MKSLDHRSTEEARAAIAERISRSGLPAETVLMGYCRTAAALFGTPIAFLSLVTAQEILFVGREGLPVLRMPREPGLCSVTIREGAWHVLADARAELRGDHNRLVESEPGIRFYAGVPIRVNGFAVGAIAVADLEPRHAGEKEVAALAELGRLAATELERNLRSTDDAVERLRCAKKDEVKSWLSYGLSHEYTNALTGAMALCETMEAATPSNSQGLLAKLERIHSRMAELTQRFRDFQGGIPQSSLPLSPNQVVDGAATLLHYVLGENIELAIDLDRALNQVEAETQGLDFPLALLLMRARNAMEGTGTLKLITALLPLPKGLETEFVDLPPGDYVAITIKDTGKQPAAEEIQGLTGWLELPANPESEAIAVWLAQDAVYRMGGQLDLAAGTGTGSSLTIFLPVVSAPPDERLRADAVHLLVVEDAAILGQALQSALERAGYRVALAKRGDAALRSFLEAKSIHLLIADVLLPGMSGIELARRLRESNPQLPVVLISGQTNQSQFGPDELPRGTVFLQKPFSMEVLLRAISGLLGSKD